MKIEVYGAGWCEDTRRSREHLDRLGLPYRYVDVDQDAKAAAWVKAQNGGKQRTPTIKVGDEVLSEPTNDELDSALRRPGSSA